MTLYYITITGVNRKVPLAYLPLKGEDCARARFTAPTHTAKGLPVTQAVIEYVSGVCRADTTDDIVEVGISGLPSIGISPEAPVRTPGTPREVFPVPGQNSPTTWSFSHTTKIYLPPGTNISLFVRSTGEQNNLQRCYLNFWGTLLTQ